VITDPVPLLAILLAVLAGLFLFNETALGRRVFSVVPLLVFAYFLPTGLSNVGLIPLESPLYEFIKDWLLPASLVLLTMAVDVRAILRLGKPAVVLFLTATATIVIGGPIAFLLFGWLVPSEMGDDVWKSLAALSGSWIGGAANMVAIKDSVGASDASISLILVVDVAVANVWMAVLLWFAGRDRQMDERLGADRSSIDDVRQRVESYQKDVQRPTNLPDLLLIFAIAIGTAAAAAAVADHLPEIGSIVSRFTWIVVISTTVALALSFTRARKLDGSGASAIGSVLLYLLVASIGAKAEFAKVLDAPALVLIGAVWLLFHAAILLYVQRKLRLPIFFAAVGSQANVGGAASAPLVAAAFHPALAPVGVLLAVGGYVLGTYAALVCAFLLEQVNGLL